MSHSFFTGTDTELYNGSRAFAAKISSSPESYGLSVEQAAAYQSLSDSYAEAYSAARNTYTRNMGATATKNIAKIALKSMAANLAKIIDGNPTVSDGQKIALGLNVRKPPSPLGPPGMPYHLIVTLRPDGLLLLKWRCQHPAGTRGVIYQIYRSVDGGERTYLGGAGRREFVDVSLPAGTRKIVYTIHATRTTLVGVAAEFPVTIGATSGDAVRATVGESRPTKIAA